jgi:hypothetical protein
MALWTEEEISVLTQFYPIYGAQYCEGKLTNRSSDSIRSKAQRLNLKSGISNHKKSGVKYSEEISKLGYENLDPYINAMTKIRHIHTLCGYIWEVSPNRLLSGVQCINCGNSTKGIQLNHKKQYNDMVLSTRGIECLDTYIDYNTKLRHKHLVCGYTWHTTPSSIFKSSGCPKCSNSGFNPSKTSTLYFISLLFNNNTYYKIGITNKLDIKDRFKSDWNKFNMQVLWSKQMSGDNVKILEQFILSKYKNNKVNLNILASGNTEILNVPIPLQELDSYVL